VEQASASSEASVLINIFPATQEVQDEEPKSLNFPAAQFEQVAVPATFAYLPAPQIAQSASSSCFEAKVAASSKYFPSAQFEQVAPIAAAYFPAGHTLQKEDPAKLNLPSSQP